MKQKNKKKHKVVLLNHRYQVFIYMHILFFKNRLWREWSIFHRNTNLSGKESLLMNCVSDFHSILKRQKQRLNEKIGYIPESVKVLNTFVLMIISTTNISSSFILNSKLFALISKYWLQMLLKISTDDTHNFYHFNWIPENNTTLVSKYFVYQNWISCG